MPLALLVRGKTVLLLATHTTLTRRTLHSDHIYNYQHRLDWIAGGQYTQFAAAVRSWLHSAQQAQLSLTFVFDGLQVRGRGGTVSSTLQHFC